MTVDDIIAGIITREGGFVNHSRDRGGATNHGITAMTLGHYRALGRAATVAEVSVLTEAEAHAIYARRQAEISVVLTDMMMPVMDGAALIDALDTLNTRVRIIAASGLAQEGTVLNVGSSRVRHFLPKPYTAANLLEVVARTLGEP